MLLKIKSTEGSTLKIEATEALLNGIKAWRLVFPKNETIFMTCRNGQWRSIGKLILSGELLNEIGIKLHPLAIANTLNLRQLEP